MEGSTSYNLIQSQNVFNSLIKESYAEDHTKNLPKEIIEKIFSYLTLHDLANTQLVCKQWELNQECWEKFVSIAFKKKSANYYSLSSIIKKINSQSDKGQQVFIKIAKIFAAKDALYVQAIVNHIKDFSIKDQQALIDIAKICAQNNARETAFYIKNFAIEDQQALIDIAKICAQKLGYDITWYIENFSINDQQQIIEIVKVCASEDPRTAGRINSFSIRNQKDLIEIAKICAQKKKAKLAAHIGNFCIKDQQALIEIAIICANKDPEITARYISNFGINDQQVLIEIAKICAQKNSSSMKYIRNFGIEDQQILIDIAMLSARNDEGTVATFIHKFGIKNQNALIDIAKLSAQKNGWATANFIENFCIRNQEALIEIAKRCARPEFIKKFGIQDQENLIEIAKVCAQHEGLLPKCIKKFGIKNQDVLIEIAKTSAKKNGVTTARFIQKFGIQDQDALIEIAKICIENKASWAWAGNVLPGYINNFCIQDQESLIEITKICLDYAEDADTLVNIMQEHAASFDWKTQLELFHRALFLNSSILSKCNNSWHREMQEFEEKKIPENQDPDLCIHELNCSFDQLVPKNLKWKSSFKDLWEYLQIKRSPYAHKQVLTWLYKIFAYLSSHPFTQEKIHFLNPILKNLANYRFPYIRNLLSIHLIDHYQNIDQLETAQKEIMAKERSSNHQKALIVYLLSSLIFSQKDRNQQRVCKKLVKYFYSFIDSHKGEYQRIVVELLYYFCRNKKLIVDEKMQILAVLVKSLKPIDSNSKKQKQTQFRNVMKSAQIILDLFQLEQEQRLKERTSCQEINLQMEELYKTELGIKVENFTEQYFKTIERWRNKQAIWTYFAKHKEDVRNAQLFKLFVQSVLDESFKTMRYEKDPHIMQIFQTHPEIVEMWKKGDIAHEQDFSLDPSVEQTKLTAKDIYKELKGGIEQKHLGEPDEIRINYPYLFEYLNAEKGKNCNYYLNILKKELHQLQNEKEHNQKKIQNLIFQRQFLQLEQIRDEDLEAKLTALLRSCSDDKGHSQFKQDIRDWIVRLAHSKNKASGNKNGLIIEDTDDPCDLLLLGTEVKNSCQRIDGDPDLNQGLLGYLLNGKNRAIIVKGPEGTIIGRCLLRLLWDKNERKPVLFQEPYYSAIEDNKVKTLVNEMCKRRANLLGLPLLVRRGIEDYLSEASAEAYPSQIESLGGQSPVEYVDALRGIQSATFLIEGCQRIATT